MSIESGKSGTVSTTTSSGLKTNQTRINSGEEARLLGAREWRFFFWEVPLCWLSGCRSARTRQQVLLGTVRTASGGLLCESSGLWVPDLAEDKWSGDKIEPP